MGQEDTWGEEAKAELVRLRAEGLSYAVIAGRLTKVLGRKCTRNMVSGMCWRMNLPKLQSGMRANKKIRWTAARNKILRECWESDMPREQINAHLGLSLSYAAIQSQAHKIGAKRTNGLRGKTRNTKPRKMSRLAMLKSQKLDMANPPPDERKDLLDIASHDCRFPIGNPGEPDFAFCGREALPEQSYCPAHYVICYDTSKDPKGSKLKTVKSQFGYQRAEAA